MTAAVLIALAVVYLAFHHHHYRKHRRARCGIWYSLRGPWGTRVSVSKRL